LPAGYFHVMLPNPVVTCPVIGYTMAHDQKIPPQGTRAIFLEGVESRDSG